MRKSTLFISAALTTFMLAVLFGVASAYQRIIQAGVPTEAAQQTQPTEVVAGTSSTITSTITLEQAADLASKVIGRSDLYAAENAQLDGVDSYLVTFSSGDIVYVSLDGKIMSISKLPVTYVLSQTTSRGGGNNGGNSSTTAAPPAQVITGGGGDQSGEDHSNEDNSNNTEDHANEDHPIENEHDD